VHDGTNTFLKGSETPQIWAEAYAWGAAGLTGDVICSPIGICSSEMGNGKFSTTTIAGAASVNEVVIAVDQIWVRRPRVNMLDREIRLTIRHPSFAAQTVHTPK
jgi:hypothetical protein